jgi:hypothetical protein
MFRAPSQAGLPSLSYMINDIPASPARIARHLGISTRTMQRYLCADQAPRVVQLALFWESRWGVSATDCHAANQAAMYYMRAVQLERLNGQLAHHVLVLEQELAETGLGAANSPIWMPALSTRSLA